MVSLFAGTEIGARGLHIFLESSPPRNFLSLHFLRRNGGNFRGKTVSGWKWPAKCVRCRVKLHPFIHCRPVKVIFQL